MSMQNVSNYIKNKWRFYAILLGALLFFISTLVFLIKFNSNDKINEKKMHAGHTIKSRVLKKNNTPSVVVTEAKIKDVPVYFSALGTVTPMESVTVKTQISGNLLKIFFHEGQIVNVGDLIAEIDSKPYQAQYIQFEGQLIRDKSFLTNARLDLKRYKTLFSSGGVSRQTLDTQIWLVKQYEGIVLSDQGQLEAVKVNINYCKIKAPIAGLVGLRQVNEGNFVQVTDTNGIVAINKLQPISVLFSLPEYYLPKIIDKLREKSKLIVYAYDREQANLLATGDLLSTDNQIDSTTGTIKLRAEFKNDSHTLFPNQFVNIKLLADTILSATVIPTAAVQHGTKGDYVFILNNNRVKFQKITIGQINENEVVVKEGIKPGEKVVIEGIDKLTDGAEVST
ncbi:efflux RND transporter periplasmic adaptor subunit [Fluviispira sanaruensis]|uniref:Efflux RND transporter periplasmic adaptor subunit n=1 Tax=Fluviispira sanaruensis TaxID=2493639 RepID=A0A4P2VME9_FLUSA|nr:efflux RND transporter periplasmic adaptor subunit [Fluviispira sanaruensis]BBH53040.1 efflux RND transporter periplasmic adaptor subunit [Fluviispira sanaruensis]